MRVLVLNAGSSSLKLSIIDQESTVARASRPWGADASRVAGRDRGSRDAIQEVAGGDIAAIDAVGHRVVHGGTRFQAATIIDDAGEAEIAALAGLAPLHNRVALETIRGARGWLRDVPQVAAFDTAFHATLPESVTRYPVPETWWRDWGIRRFGFHGLSVEWSMQRAAELLGRDPTELSLVVAHLGSGCSVTAVDRGRSAWTSMGMTPLEGLMMGTRAGSLDPGVLLRILREERLDVEALADVLDHGSGLLAVGGTADLTELERRAALSDATALLAIEMFIERAAQGIAAASTALPRLDALVFTGGIGEHSSSVRTRIVSRLGTLGFAPLGDDAPDHDAVLGPPTAGPQVLRIEAREDLMIARQTEALFGTPEPPNAPVGQPA